METNTTENNHSQLWLENLIAEKIKKNPQFSLRAFARMVDVSPAVLSRILSGKRKLTFNLATRIADALVLGPVERDTLYSFFLSSSSEEKTEEEKVQKELSIDCFNAMKEWYHYGITQLLYIESFKEDSKWISKMLSITELEAKMAIERLLRLEILDRDENGKLYRTATHLSTTTDIASAGIRHFQKQILEKSIESLEKDDVLERDITSITIAINEDRLAEAKLEIKKFRMKMSEFLSTGEKTRVYNLGVHLIPLSKSVNGDMNELN
ncbi:TIGR02147 family protein [Bacteriovorax sp. PP10]|uniref:TIGR02147 family protein n=1 Tax=Bacteriovorax antarcticus TaxID=3088717 RepID=A0ABU5VSA1_9BACT|nr:TIGR02147 family protein [Bacteriovorax sp. PP10]MEA9355472.1 TIGR02147 family protein [Bacteriovorax sp. PP10]